MKIHLIQFLMNKENGYTKIDFTRGNEKYKYVLGGVEHYNHLLEFSIKK